MKQFSFFLILLPLVAMAQPKFVITGTENRSIQEVVDDIRSECGDGCEIQFGDGTSVLDIEDSGIEFKGDWGEITLTGKIISDGHSAISIYDGVSVVSKASIEAKFYAVDNKHGGELSIIGGNIKAEQCAVNNHGNTTISNGNIEAEDAAVCNHYAELTISGGNIKAEWGAVFNDGDISSEEPALITINGGNIEAEMGTIINDGGEIIIIDGSIKADYGAVVNEYGKITIKGGNIEAKAETVINDDYDGEIIISGGNIKAIVAAVVNKNGKLTIKGGNIRAMGVAVVNLDIRALALNAVKLIITGGSISIIPGDIPLDLILDIKDLLTDLLDSDELDVMDLAKYAICYIGDASGFSLEGVVDIAGEVKNTIGKTTPILPPRIANNQIGIKTTANTITLENLPKNTRVDVYNVQGKQIYSTHSENSRILKIPVQTKGMYIVKVGTQTMRAVVR